MTWLLGAAADAVATSAPDLRTAIATEYLTIATWALFGVALATFAAAVVAAIYAVRTYRLEESPGVVFAEALVDVITMRQVPAAVILRRLDPAARVLDPVGPLELRPLSLFNVEQLALSDQVSATFEVRNVGRSAVVEASVLLQAVVSELDFQSGFEIGGSIATQESIVEGTVRISSIAANESVLLPVASGAGPCKVKVIGVTALTPATRAERSKRRALPFVSSQMLLHAKGAIRPYLRG
jgi:hypothetical protein